MVRKRSCPAVSHYHVDFIPIGILLVGKSSAYSFLFVLVVPNELYNLEFDSLALELNGTDFLSEGG